MDQTDTSLEQRATEAEKEITAILDKYHLDMGGVPDFPRYRQLPTEVQLALQVLQTHGVIYKVAFQEKKEAVNGTGN